MKKDVIFLDVSDLVLDIKNPRFGELYTGSNKEEDLIEYLLFNESAISVLERLSTTKEFYIDKPLLVLKEGKKYIVKDGNRRCAAVKALMNPPKYGLNFPSYNFKELPVVVYDNKSEIENRITEEHTNSMFREWDRIAKAIEAFRQFKSGSSVESMFEIDTKPVDLIKLASFYYEAVKIGGDELKKLLRKGRGGTGGKTTIFERLFKYGSYFGFGFKNKPNYVIEITDKKKFSKYVKSVIKYLNTNSLTTYRDVDDKEVNLFSAIGIKQLADTTKNPISNIPTKKVGINKSTRHYNKFQSKPQYNRTIPLPLKKIIDECYDLSELTFPNAKISMCRVVFECCLKYIVEETKYNSKSIKDYSYFSPAFFDKNGKKLKYTNFSQLKSLFENFVSNIGKSNAFKSFDLDTPNQIIHNYNIASLSKDTNIFAGNLIPLVEFMLDTEKNLLNSIDLKKLI